MTEDVMIQVRGLQLSPEGGQDEVELIAPGAYYFKNGRHYFLYEEVMEGSGQVTKNLVKASEHRLELTKRGAVNVFMLFEQGRKNISCYNTPFGSLQIGIDAAEIHVTESGREVGVEVEYDLDINSCHIASCRLQMTAAARDGAGGKPLHPA